MLNANAYAMAGASKNHERISMNVSYEFSKHLRDSLLRPPL